MKTRAFLKLVLLLVVNVSLFAYAMFQGAFVSWFLFYSILVLSCITVGTVFFSFRGFAVERIFSPEFIKSGDELTVTITIKKGTFQPFFYLRVTDFLPLQLEKYKNVATGAMFFFTFRTKLTFSYTLANMPRGEFEWDTVELRLGDLFGLFEKRKVVQVASSIVSYPAYRELRDWSVGNTRQGESTVAFDRSIEEELSIAGVRQYIPGDRLTSIDWKQSARRNTLMTKEFESFKGNRYTICLYTPTESEGIGRFEHAVKLAASFVNFFYQKENSFSMAIVGTETTVSGYGARIDHCRSIYRKLAVVKPSVKEEEVNFPHTLQSEVVLFITTTMSPSFYNKITLLHQHATIVVCWITPSHVKEQENQIKLSLQQTGIRIYQFKGNDLRYELNPS